MARKVKFPLHMANGANVRMLEELKDNFDMGSIYIHYKTGKLLTWLRDRDCSSEVQNIEKINEDENVFQQLYAAFGIEPDPSAPEPDIARLDRMIEIRNELVLLGVDREVLDNLDGVALTQEDLEACIRDGKKQVYLVKGEFDVRELPEDIKWIKVSDPVVKEKPSQKTDEISSTVTQDKKRTRFGRTFEEIIADNFFWKEYRNKFNRHFLNDYASSHHDSAAYVALACCCFFGYDGEVNEDDAKKYLNMAAEQNDLKAKIIRSELFGEPQNNDFSQQNDGLSLEKYGSFLTGCDQFYAGEWYDEYQARMLSGYPYVDKVRDCCDAKDLYDKKNYSQALELLKLLVNEPIGEWIKRDFYYNIGMMYALGKGIKADLPMSKEWLLEAQKAGCHNEALENLLTIVEFVLENGEDAFDHSAHLMNKYGATLHHCDAFQVGRYSSPAMKDAKNHYGASHYLMAFRLAKSEAEIKHDSYAMYDVGMMYAFGKGIPENFQQAKYWLEKSAQNRELQTIASRLLDAVNTELYGKT